MKHHSFSKAFCKTLALLGCALGFFLGAIPSVLAHDPGLSSANLALEDDRLQAVLAFHPGDLRALLAGKGGSSETLENRATDLVPALLEVRIDGHLISADSARIVHGENRDWEMHCGFSGVHGSRLEMRGPDFAQLPPGHRQFASLKDATGKVIATQMFSAAANVFTVDLSPKTGAAPPETPHGFGPFFFLGVEHILTGYDHLLFLFALLLVCQSFRGAALVITCFTLAHSITLALATFDLVRLPSNIIEPAIAASIVYVGLENIFRNGRVRGRWLLTFVFGLVHGLGFASVLRELGIGARGTEVVVPLFSFNFGVEAGQLAVAGILFPLILTLRRWPGWTPRWVVGGSTAVVLAGAYWFFERTLGS